MGYAGASRRGAADTLGGPLVRTGRVHRVPQDQRLDNDQALMSVPGDTAPLEVCVLELEHVHLPSELRGCMRGSRENIQ